MNGERSGKSYGGGEWEGISFKAMEAFCEDTHVPNQI